MGVGVGVGVAVGVGVGVAVGVGVGVAVGVGVGVAVGVGVGVEVGESAESGSSGGGPEMSQAATPRTNAKAAASALARWTHALLR